MEQERARKVRILLVDDHPLIRGGLVELVNRQADMEVCAEAGTDSEALRAAETCAPELAVVDLALGDADGLQLLRDLSSRFPRMRLLVLSMHEEELYAERALRAGASGYVMKHERLHTVVEAMRCVLAGEVFLSPAMQSKLMQQLVRGKSGAGEPVASLTDRELQIFGMLGQGLGPSEIAKRLHLSVKTIDAHRARIKDKLNVRTAAELRRRAIAWQRDGSLA
ncbi:MAG: response regulator [Myxococcota bacterium]